MMMGLAMMGWLAFVGCGTETGNPAGDVSLLYNARSQVPELVSLEPGADTTSVSAAWLRLDPVELSLDCKGKPDATFDALGLADHAGDDAFEQLSTIPDGPYCALETTFVVDEEGEGIAAGASIALEGTLADGRAFEVVVPETVDVSLDIDGAVRPDAGSWLITFDVGTWLDPDALADLPGDPVSVSPTDHAAVYDTLLERIAPGVQLHLDVDGNGAVDAEDPRLDLP